MMASTKIALLRAECLAQFDKLAEESIVHEKYKSALEYITHDILDVSNFLDKTVYLNVGGASVFINRSSIISHGTGNYLFKLLSGKYDHLLPKDKNGRIFLDLDVKWVEPEFNLLRDMAMWNGDKQSMPKLSQSHSVYDGGRTYIQTHFCMKNIDNLVSDDLFNGSAILADKMLVNAESVLVDMLTVKGAPTVSGCKLLYQASSNGISGKSFHSACVGIENTLFIVKDTEGNILGGFSDVALEIGNTLKAAPNAFLFSLIKNNEFNPIKHMGKNGSAIMCDTSSLLGFTNMTGHYYELCLRPPPTCSFTQVGRGGFEEQPQGLQKQCTQFEIKDMEVYRISFTSSAPETSEQCLHAITALCKGGSTIDATLALKIELLTAQLELLESAKKLCDEQKFIAKFLSVNVPITAAVNDTNLSEFQLLLHEIQMIDKLLTVEVDNGQTHDISDAVSSIVYINVGGTVLAVSKATLLQAPSGSILANMASDVWGHDLDSEGNIIQDVNPELFTAIINHLRLKALLFDTEVPPITVYEEQKTGLDNLLAFYGMENVPVKLITRTPIVYKLV